jgi:hypothetical protein
VTEQPCFRLCLDYYIKCLPLVESRKSEIKGGDDKGREYGSVFFFVIYLSCIPLFTGIYVREISGIVPAQIPFVCSLTRL